MLSSVAIIDVSAEEHISLSKKWPEKLRGYAPTKGNQEKTDRIIDSIDIIDLIDILVLLDILAEMLKISKSGRIVDL